LKSSSWARAIAWRRSVSPSWRSATRPRRAVSARGFEALRDGDGRLLVEIRTKDEVGRRDSTPRGEDDPSRQVPASRKPPPRAKEEEAEKLTSTAQGTRRVRGQRRRHRSTRLAPACLVLLVADDDLTPSLRCRRRDTPANHFPAAIVWGRRGDRASASGLGSPISGPAHEGVTGRSPSHARVARSCVVTSRGGRRCALAAREPALNIMDTIEKFGSYEISWPSPLYLRSTPRLEWGVRTYGRRSGRARGRAIFVAQREDALVVSGFCSCNCSRADSTWHCRVRNDAGASGFERTGRGWARRSGSQAEERCPQRRGPPF